MLPTCSPKAAENPNSRHIQPSADVGTKRYDECFPARSRVELKAAPHPGTFYIHIPEPTGALALSSAICDGLSWER